MNILEFFLPVEWVMIISLTVLFLIQLFYYLLFYNWPLIQKKRERDNTIEYSEEQLPVSIVVYSCNDADNLEQFLPKILHQNYSKFEVIVVNDGSTDDTKDVLKKFAEQYPQLYYTTIPEDAKNHSRRKLAMSVGIKAAKHDWIITTEANCEVAGEEWIATIARNFTPSTDVVLLYSTFNFEKSRFSAFRSLNNLFFGLRYLGMAAKGRPFMGIRRNLAYRKELYFRNRGGFSGHLYLKDGDDDIFINKIARKENTRIEIAPESITKSHYYDIDDAWKDFKLSYAITSAYLERNGSFFFGFESFSRYLFYLVVVFGAILGVLNPLLFLIVAPLFLIRLGVQLIIVNKVAKQLNERGYFISLLFYDIAQPIIDAYYKVSGKMSKRR